MKHSTSQLASQIRASRQSYVLIAALLSAIVCTLGCSDGSRSAGGVAAVAQVDFEGSWTDTEDNQSTHVTTLRKYNVVQKGGRFRVETTHVQPLSVSTAKTYDGTTLSVTVKDAGIPPVRSVPDDALLDAFRFWQPPPLDGYEVTNPATIVAGRPAVLYTLWRGASISLVIELYIDKTTGMLLRRVMTARDKNGFVESTSTLEVDKIGFDPVGDPF